MVPTHLSSWHNQLNNYGRKQDLIDMLHQQQMWQTMMLSPQNNINYVAYVTSSTATTACGNYMPTFTVTATAPRINSGTAIGIATVANSPPDELMSSEDYALQYMVKWLEANCMTLSDVSSKLFGDARLELQAGNYKLPGGSILTIDADKSYTIDDSNHKTVYAANPTRSWNEFIGVSDVLDKFMQYVASLNLTKEQFLELPMRLFMLWLIISAAKKDKEPVPETENQQLELALQSYQPQQISREEIFNASFESTCAVAVAR